MKKIAIITELSLNSTNYGNNIQAYALNKYLRNKYPDYSVQTILLKKGTGREITSIIYYIKRITKKIQIVLKKRKDYTIDIKKEMFNEFIKKHILVSHDDYTYDELKKSSYDYYVVGSDIVWFQSKGFINRAKFLAFKPVKKGAKKIAYAASFGENNIPAENKNKVIEYIKNFDAISVREKNSISFLNGNGVSNVIHVCDPTLLLNCNEWEEIARNAIKIEKYTERKYAFVYIIGTDKHDREINRICNKMGIKPVFVSCEKQSFEDSQSVDCFDDCSPQEWIWMIRNAEFVFTDSFHGLIFSTIFKKRFFAIKRDNIRNLNIRLTDYLGIIGEMDKLVDIVEVDSPDDYIWDYSRIEDEMRRLIEKSNKYILKSIS